MQEKLQANQQKSFTNKPLVSSNLELIFHEKQTSTPNSTYVGYALTASICEDFNNHSRYSNIKAR